MIIITSGDDEVDDKRKKNFYWRANYYILIDNFDDKMLCRSR